MCDVRQIVRSTFYYKAKEQVYEAEVTAAVMEIFHMNHKAYGTRKIKVKLNERGFVVSRLRIDRMIIEQGLVFTYTIAQYKSHKKTCNMLLVQYRYEALNNIVRFSVDNPNQEYCRSANSMLLISFCKKYCGIH